MKVNPRTYINLYQDSNTLHVNNDNAVLEKNMPTSMSMYV